MQIQVIPLPPVQTIVQWTGDNFEEVRDFLVNSHFALFDNIGQADDSVHYNTALSHLVVPLGWWVVGGNPMSDQALRAQYQQVEGTDAEYALNVV